MRTIRAIKRLFTELPQPASTFYWCFIALFVATFLLGVVTRVNWAVLGNQRSGRVFVSIWVPCLPGHQRHSKQVVEDLQGEPSN